MSDIPRPAELKRRLKAHGYEIYRTLQDRVVLAERVRDNLIMDSGIAVASGSPLRVHLSVRAQASHFPGADEAQLGQEAESLAAPFVNRGYQVSDRSAEDVTDPGHPERVLDQVHQLALHREFNDLDAVFSEIGELLKLPRHSEDE